MVSSCYTFAKGILLSKSDNVIKAFRGEDIIATISFDGWDTEILDGNYSPTYAIMEKVQTLKLVSTKTERELVLKMKIKIYI